MSTKPQNPSARPSSRRGFIAGLGALTVSGAVLPGRRPVHADDSGPDKYQEASDRALHWLLGQLHEDGSFGPEIDELTSYFKIANLFTVAGRLPEANQVLAFIKRRYMQADGDFKMSAQRKSGEVDYYEKVWPYANGWITFTAQKMGRFDLSFPAFRFLQSFYHAGTGGFTSNPPHRGAPVIDLLATTHLGMVSLYMGDQPKAIGAGALVQRFLSDQSDLGQGLYTRMSGKGELITAYAAEDAPYYFLNAREPGQFYFLAGYPIAFLGKLFRATGNEAYVATGKQYFDFASGCAGIHDSHFAHKVAWGSSVLYNLTRDPRYSDFALTVADYLVRTQDREGSWFGEQPPSFSFDQSAECAIWLRKINSELAFA